MPDTPKDPQHAQFALAFGMVVRVARRERKMKQAAIAYATGVRTSTVAQWENGRSLPSFAALLKIAAAVDLPPSKLVSAAEKALHLTHIRDNGGNISANRAGVTTKESTDAQP